MSYEDYLSVYNSVHDVMMDFYIIRLIPYDKRERESLGKGVIYKLAYLEKVCDGFLLNGIRSMKEGIFSYVFDSRSYRDRVGIAVEVNSLFDCISKVCIEGLESYGIWV